MKYIFWCLLFLFSCKQSDDSVAPQKTTEELLLGTWKLSKREFTTVGYRNLVGNVLDVNECWKDDVLVFGSKSEAVYGYNLACAIDAKKVSASFSYELIKYQNGDIVIAPVSFYVFEGDISPTFTIVSLSDKMLITTQIVARTIPQRWIINTYSR